MSAGKESLRHLLTKPDWYQAIGAATPFGEPANGFFMAAVSKCESYLEFGAGSSTLVASALTPRLVSVESDRQFLGAVQRLCAGKCQSADFIYAEIGPTGPWGAPILKSRVWRQTHRWDVYPLAPWNKLGLDYRADLILIDGRFRVACALAVITRQPDVQWTMLVDDYTDRPEYSVIERFADLRETYGRMAVFKPRRGMDLAVVETVRAKYIADWR